MIEVQIDCSKLSVNDVCRIHLSIIIIIISSATSFQFRVVWHTEKCVLFTEHAPFNIVWHRFISTIIFLVQRNDRQAPIELILHIICIWRKLSLVVCLFVKFGMHVGARMRQPHKNTVPTITITKYKRSAQQLRSSKNRAKAALI